MKTYKPTSIALPGLIGLARPSVAPICLLLTLAITASACAAGNRDPETGRIRVLYVGEPTGSSPYPMLESEPLILPDPVKASTVVFSLDIARRSVRQYMPRTYESLSSYQVLILSDANADVFTASQLQWYSDAVMEGGSGLVMIGGNEAFGGRGGQRSWGTTPVEDVLPVNSLDERWTEGKVVIVDANHPMVASIPIGPNLEWMKYYDGNEVELKTGASELAQMLRMAKPPAPFWATWESGKGRTFAMAGDWTPAGGVIFMRWEYYGDFAVNLMLYLSKNELPEDLETVHKARGKFLEYRWAKAYKFTVMDFGEKFGANMNPVAKIIDEAESRYADATQAYLEQDLGTSLEALDDSLESLARGTQRAMRLKDQAMLWIYAVEWTTISGTFAASGFAVWTLMIRRRLYREIGSTKFGR